MNTLTRDTAIKEPVLTAGDSSAFLTSWFAHSPPLPRRFESIELPFNVEVSSWSRMTSGSAYLFYLYQHVLGLD